jgi:VIT1/CCC1 family predicted Fe2+/Mn2+ transporter
VFRAIEAHLGSRQVSRVIYGAIIGLALILTLEQHPPGVWVVIGSLLGTAAAVALAELYSDIVGTEASTRRRVRRAELRHMGREVAAVAGGVAFPVVFFLLAAVHAIEKDAAFTIAKWSGVGLIGFYGFWAARLAGDNLRRSAVRALAVAFIGAFLIALKALVH